MGLKKLSLMSRILLIVTLACGLCAAVSIQGFLYFNQQELERGIINKERTVHTQLGAATEYVARQGGLPDVIAKFSKKYTSATQMTDEDKREILNQVPIYAALSIGKKNASVDNYQFRVFSDEPRRKENQADAREIEIFRRFERDPALEDIVLNENGVITMYRPVRLSEAQGCLACHGNPANSPWNDGTDILGHRMENWKDGKLHGVFAISQNIAAVAAAANAGHAVTPSAWLIGAIVLGALASLVFSALMVRGTVATLNRITGVLCGATTQVHEASEDIATSSRKLAESSSEQAASLEETSSSIEEMSSMVRKNSDNAKSTADTSGGSREKAQEGQQVVRRMMESMSEIDRSNQDIMAQVNNSNEQMAGIVKVIEEIGLKTRVINDIVFQTKLLSFNASVEAARAGEHGKGFAVVAEEVGNLAAMSGNAAKEISDMLEESQRKVSAIADSTKTEIEQLINVGKVKVENGAQIARQCGEVLNDIVTNVSSVSQMAGEISNASQEQATGVHELTKAMHQLDQATQQNSAIAEKSAHSAQSLADQANSLRSALNNLVATVRGEGAVDEAEQKGRAA